MKPFPVPIPSPCFHQEKRGHMACQEIICTPCLDLQYGDTGSSIPGLLLSAPRGDGAVCVQRGQ